MQRRIFLISLVKYIALANILSCAITKGTIKEKKVTSFSFIVCNDIHISTQEHSDYFAKSIENWNSFSDHFDFVVINGDLVEYGTPQEFTYAKNHLALLKKPYYTVLGNHDVSNRGVEGKSAYREAFGLNRENYFIQHKEVCCIFLDITDGQRANVSMQESTILWLKNALLDISKETPLIVFSHFPLHPETPKFPVRDAHQLFNLLENRIVLGYFSGHYHSLWQSKYNNAPFYGNTCLSLLKDNFDGTTQEGYLFVTLKENELAVEFVLRGEKPQTLK